MESCSGNERTAFEVFDELKAQGNAATKGNAVSCPHEGVGVTCGCPRLAVQGNAVGEFNYGLALCRAEGFALDF
jgi:hypothetical protein